MNRVVHFEIAAPDPEQASHFYAGVFGWQISKWNGPETYWLISTGANGAPGIDGGMMLSQDGKPSTINTIEVSSVEEYVERVQAHGGQVAHPKMAIPEVGYLAYCMDPGGGLFGIIQMDPTAQ